jgi:hypothetical protein
MRDPFELTEQWSYPDGRRNTDGAFAALRTAALLLNETRHVRSHSGLGNREPPIQVR